MNHTRIAPFTGAIVQLAGSVTDDTYVLEPNREVLFQKGLALPMTIITCTAAKTTVFIANTTNIAQDLSAGTCVAFTTINNIKYVNTVSDHTVPLTSHFNDHHDPFKLLRKNVSTDLPPEQQDILYKLLCSFIDIFDFNSRPLAQTSAVKHTIDTGTEKPIRSRPYRVSRSEREVIQRHVSDMLQQNIIEESASPWSSPVVLVKKKDGT